MYGASLRPGFVLDPLGGTTCRLTHGASCGGRGGPVVVWTKLWSLMERRFDQSNDDLRTLPQSAAR